MDNDLYQQESQNNQEQFFNQLKLFRPDIHALAQAIDETGVSVYVLLKVIRGLKNLSLGTQWGKVEVEIQNNQVLFVKTIESDRLDTPLTEKKELHV